MKKRVKIYCLYDEKESKIRYIGRTTKKVLSHRLIEHITKSRYYKTYKPNGKPSHKEAWVLSVLKKGYEPKIKLLCEINGWTESHTLERSLIKKYRDTKDLVNSADRGEGGLNTIVTEESKIKISDALKEHYKNNKSKSSKKVYSYDLSGDRLKEFQSSKECAEYYNITPSKVCGVIKGNYKQWKGIRYSREENIKPLVKIKRVITKLKKKVKVLDIETNTSIIYDGVNDATEAMNLPKGTIQQTLTRTNTKLYKKRYKFIYLP